MTEEKIKKVTALCRRSKKIFTKEQIENANYVYEQIKKYIDKQAE